MFWVVGGLIFIVVLLSGFWWIDHTDLIRKNRDLTEALCRPSQQVNNLKEQLILERARSARMAQDVLDSIPDIIVVRLPGGVDWLRVNRPF